jgi:predicted nucleic acid-binding protein
MHDLFLDTNILVDYLGHRAPFDRDAELLFTGFYNRNYKGRTSIINLVHVHYQLRRQLSEERTRLVLNQLVDIIEIVDIPGGLTKNALYNWTVIDFEDAVQYELARISQSDFFITRNLKDFPKNAPFTICDAATYLNNYSLKG